MIVAIDGPAGTGKGTVSKLISERLGFVNIDTGAMYRALTLNIIRNNKSLDDHEGILNVLKYTNIELMMIGNTQKTYLNGEDVSSLIRTQAINEKVSAVSAIKEVREKLVGLQRKFATGKDIVMEGRDITTVVFPDAEVKIYLTAEHSERVNRRYKEMIEKGIKVTYDEIEESITKRDLNDTTKEHGRLMIAEDAVVIDSTSLTIEEVYERIKEIILLKRKNAQ